MGRVMDGLPGSDRGSISDARIIVAHRARGSVQNGLHVVGEPTVQGRQGAPVPHAGGQDLLGLDALVGGFVVVDEQALVEQEAPSGAHWQRPPAAAWAAPPSW